MEEQLITLETAKLAKEKGFNIPCMYSINELHLKECSLNYTGNDTFTIEDVNEASENTKILHLLAPTQSLLQRWLREVHNISVLVEHGRMEDYSFGYFCRIYSKIPSTNQFKIFEYRNSYEEALETGLQEALKFIKL